MCFSVFESKASSQDVIVGWPNLQDECYYLLLDVLMTQRAARLALQQSVVTSIETADKVLLYNVDGPYFQPFTHMIEDAPEELLSPAPVNFEYFLNFMETSHDVALETYISEIPYHCSPEMLAATNLEALLTTKGTRVICPTEWSGIADVIVDLKWKSSPPRRKLPPRAINPKLLDVAKVEFDRLLNYMYVYCDSEVVSPLVIAPKATTPFVRFCGGYVDVNKYIEVGHWFHMPRKVWRKFPSITFLWILILPTLSINSVSLMSLRIDYRSKPPGVKFVPCFYLKALVQPLSSFSSIW